MAQISSLIGNLFGCGLFQAPDDPQQADPSSLMSTWDEFPDAVRLHILNHLDRHTLNEFRQVSTSARHLIDNNFGLKVILPAREWAHLLAGSAASKTVVTDEMLQLLVLQMERKRIHSLEMIETPPQLSPFQFSRFIRYPENLLHVKLKYVDIDLLHDILRHCGNLQSFNYKTGYQRHPPRGYIAILLFGSSFMPVPAPSTNANLVAKVTGFQPEVQYLLPHLRELTLTISQMTAHDNSDWGNVAYLLLCLPSLPSLLTFQFSLHPGEWTLGSRTHLVIVSCFAEFLRKTPNLRELHFLSNATSDDNFAVDNPDWLEMLRSLIRRFGSDTLIDLADATVGPAPLSSFLMLTGRLLQVSAESLHHLKLFEIQTIDDLENVVFCSFVRSLPDRVPLTTCRIKDLTVVKDDLLSIEAIYSKVYKMFTLSFRDDVNARRLRQLPPPIPAYQQVTELDVSCSFPRNTIMSLNLIVETLPLLRSLCLRNHSLWSHDAVLLFQANPDQNSHFTRLEKLYLENVSFDDLPRPEPSATALILRCKNLTHLTIRYLEQSTLGPYSAVAGISSQDLLCIVSSLRKLRQVRLDQIHFTLSQISLDLTIEENRKRSALCSIGGVLRNYPNLERVFMFHNGISSLVTLFDFTFSE